MSGVRGRSRHPQRVRAGDVLLEVTVIIIVLSILCAILAPVIGRCVRHAKVVRCREDIQSIASAIWQYVEDTGNSYFLRDGSPDPAMGASRVGGSAPSQAHTNRTNLLVSDGDIPECRGIPYDIWCLPVDYASVDFMEYHLVTNTPGDAANNAYRTPLDLGKGAAADPGDPMFSRDSSGGFNSRFSWRGPYLTAPIGPDPWGNRYAVNVIYLDPLSDSSNADVATNGVGGWVADCVVVSAGPDEEIDTDYHEDGLTPGDDDLLYTLSANSRP